MDYKSTLNLPKTDFSVQQAGLPEKGASNAREVVCGSRLRDGTIEKTRASRCSFCTTAPLCKRRRHLGTALNKTLKDFIVRYKNMSGL